MARADRMGSQWSGKSLRALVIAAPILIGAVLRFYQLRTLPPGLSPAEANMGLVAAAFARHGILPHFTSMDGFSPLLAVLEGGMVALLGIKVTVLRLVPALIGTATIWLVWLWVRSWFDRRIGWLAAFLVAVSPWALTISRNAEPTVLGPFLLVTLLWLATKLVRGSRSLATILGLAAAVILALLAGPWGWLALVTSGVVGLVAGLVYRTKLSGLSTTARIVALGLAITTVVLAVVAGIIIRGSAALRADFKLASPGHILGKVGGTLGQFYLHGDDNFTHNLGGTPLLNAFVGLMVVAGAMVVASRLHHRRERVLIALVPLTLLPDLISVTGGNNASRAAAALPVIAVLAAIGISYLLELWSSTFPINSAARSLGLGVMGLLLILTLLQGYTQYFTAWANSSPTYTAYDRSSTQSAAYAIKHHTAEQTYVVTLPDEQPAADYLSYGNAHVSSINPAAVGALPTATALRLVITSEAHDQLLPILHNHLPGGTLKPHYDTDGSELFYSYEAAAQ